MKISRHILSVIIMVAGIMGSVTATASDHRPVVRSMAEKRYENVVRQQWELSCASAALATILRYQHGVPVSERIVALGLINRPEYFARPDLIKIRQGFSLLDLKRYVDSIGYQGVGLGKLDLDDLRAHAPIIVPVNLQGYPHFVVFRGATQHEVLLADPAFGNVTMSIKKFLKGWINYRDFEHVGFLVKQAGQQVPPGKLRADASDFVLLRQP